MKICRTEDELRKTRDAESLGGAPIGFVPTMGALHDGHLSLVRAARKANDVVVLSIFVNPLQFGPAEDFSAYPRDEERDLRLAEAEGVDIAFLPSVDEMYAPDRSTTVSVARISEVLEGKSRPGHFDGVCTVVAKLLNQVMAKRAYFGQKDAQQAAVVKRMVRDLSIPTEIVVCPIVREADGLAMSSRNAYLSAEERAHAANLFKSLKAGEAALAAGGGPGDAEAAMRDVLEATPAMRVDYAAAVDPETFDEALPGGPVLLAVAARVGPARLIDNLLVEAKRRT
jgi:pantoate--beta-alanine ligase